MWRLSKEVFIFVLVYCTVLCLCSMKSKLKVRTNASKQQGTARQITTMLGGVDTRPRDFRDLKPLPCVGVYELNKINRQTSFFLGPDRMVCQEREDGKCILRGLVPVLVPPGFEPPLSAAMAVSSAANTAGNGDDSMHLSSWSGQVIMERNKALYDNLQDTFQWASQQGARRRIYEALRLKGSCPSPYHGIVSALEQFAGLQVRGLLVELADSPSPNEYVLGAALLIAKSKHAHRWGLTYKQPSAIQRVRGSDEAQLVKCAMDELIGIAFATRLPVVISTKLYDSTSVDGILEQNTETLRMTMQAPYFSTAAEAQLWESEQRRRAEARKNRSVRAAKPVSRANEVPDASTFLRLRTSEKRAILRATGVLELPRPREGPRAVDALLIPLLDEEVAYEVLRRLGETRGDFQAAAQMQDFESRKPKLARLINQAKREGDFETAQQVSNRYHSYRANHTHRISTLGIPAHLPL